MLIKVKEVYLEDRILSPAYIEIEDRKFKHILDESEYKRGNKFEEYQDYGTYIAAPG